MTSDPAVEESLGDDRDADGPIDSRIAHCPACDRETEHEVTVEMADTSTDRIDDERRKFAQCPERVVTCAECGRETRSRVNR